jgi:hypothetical protein
MALSCASHCKPRASMTRPTQRLRKPSKPSMRLGGQSSSVYARIFQPAHPQYPWANIAFSSASDAAVWGVSIAPNIPN